jgi:hypothetical protein
MRRLAAAALSVVLAAVAGCGTSVAPSTSPPAQTVQPTPSPTPRPTPAATPVATAADFVAAAEAMVEEGTVQLELEVSFEGSDLLAEGIGIFGNGQASFGEERQMSADMDMKAFGMGRLEMILDDQIVYMRGPALSEITGGADTWLRIDTESDHPLAQDLASSIGGSNDTSLSVYYLYGIDEAVVYEGSERVGGVNTERYATHVDLEKALDEVPAATRPVLERNIGEILDGGVEPTLGAVVWLGEGFIRRVEYTFDLGSEMGGGNMIGRYGFSAFGEPLDIDIPTSFEYVDLEDVVPA